MTGRQLPLDLPHDPSFAREDFLSSPANAEARLKMEAWPDWPGGMLLLTGPAGSGKSHLAAIWAGRAGATILEAGTLSAGTQDLAALLIENADRVGANEAALFHLINRAREAGARLLLTARAAPDSWGLKTPDLLSRL